MVDAFIFHVFCIEILAKRVLHFAVSELGLHCVINTP